MGYNDRLFRGSRIRRWYHLARFRWLESKFNLLDGRFDIIEIGCFDGRSLDYIPSEKIKSYDGYDAGWEGGIQFAIENRSCKDVSFTIAKCANDIRSKKNYDVLLSLETLEHLSDIEIKNYFDKLKHVLRADYVIVFTVPNELGALFLIKTFLKWVLYKDSEGYTILEVLYQTMGKTHKVKRNQHKGFNYKLFAEEVQSTFGKNVEVTGVQFPFFPNFLNPSIGILVK